MEDRTLNAFAYDGTTVADRRRARTFRSRFAKVKSALVAAPAAVPAVSVEVSPEEFEHVQECMNNPQGPTQALLAGAELIRNLGQKNR